MLPAVFRAGRLQQIVGEVLVNGRLASRANEIHTLDVIRTGTSGRLVLVMGRDAMLIRANSEVEILWKRNAALSTGLRMLTGALLAVSEKWGQRRLLTMTATTGIRGTGIYIKFSSEQTYFCTCYGSVQIAAQHRTQSRLVVSGCHAPNIVHAQMTDGKMMQRAEIINHTDEKLVMLERPVGRVPRLVSWGKTRVSGD